MTIKTRLRQALAATGHVPDDEILDELAQHAQAMYEMARADGGAPAEARGAGRSTDRPVVR